MKLFSSHFIFLLCLLSGLVESLFSAAIFHNENDENILFNQDESKSIDNNSNIQDELPTLSTKLINQRNTRNLGNSNDENINRNLNKNTDLFNSDEENHDDDTSKYETFYANYGIEDNHQNDDKNNMEVIDNDNKLANDQPYPYKKRPMTFTNKLLYTKEIQLKQGKIKGIIRNFHIHSGLKDIDQFLGIPYAEAPVGSRRFMPAGAPLQWNGLKTASHLPPVCPQNLPDLNLPNKKFSKGRYDQIKRLLPYLKNENEDCLYLNIYAPQRDRLDQPRKYPVIVYIHGESYEWNSGNPYDGSVLASYGQVIVITLNFRLGILGFMKPGINEHTVSNFGLLDQIAALQWIKENIDSFDGDANRVTLMGHGTGGSFVNFLMVSPVAVGLFHRAILMSGSAMSDWATSNQSLTLTMQIAHGLNCPLIDENEELLNCLRKKRYQEFLKIPTSFPQFTTSLGPIVDGHVIPNQPYKVMSQYTDLFSRYDLLFGVTEIESYHIIDSIALEEGLRENERDQLLRLYMKSRYEIRPDLALAATLKKYTDVYNNPIKASSHEHRDVVLDILSDARIVGPLLQTGLFHADVNPRSYMYVFGHNSEAGPYSSLPRSIIGEELAFVFGAPLAPSGPFPQQYSPQEKLLSEAVMLYWTNFAKTGNPKAPWREIFLNLHRLEWDNYDIDWPEFNKRNQCYVNIGIPPSLEYKYRQIYMNYWNKELPDELNQISLLLQTKPNFHYSNHHQQLPRGGTSVDYNNEIITGQLRKYTNNDKKYGISGGSSSSSSTYPISSNPFNELRLLMKEPIDKIIDSSEIINNLNNNNDNMLNAQPTFGILNTELPSSSINNYQSKDTINNQNDNNNNNDILKTESTLHILIGLIIVFLILNIIIYSAFLFRQKKNNNNNNNKISTSSSTAMTNFNRKLGILSYDGTNDDDLKRRSIKTGGDCDDSYILDMMLKKSTSNIYDLAGNNNNKNKNHSPINGFKITRQISSSTLDTHTKVSDWMSQDIIINGINCQNEQINNNNNKSTIIIDDSNHNNNNNKNSKKTNSYNSSTSSFSLKGRKFLKRPQKISIGIDATPQARSNSILRQEPIEITKLKSIDDDNQLQNNRNIIICQEIDITNAQYLCNNIDDNDNKNSQTSLQNHINSDINELQIDNNYIRSNPIDMINYTINHNDNNNQYEKITSFIENNNDNINITSQNDNVNIHNTLSPMEQLITLRKRNFPKVSSNINENNCCIQQLDAFKRQSLPPNSYNNLYGCGGRIPPIPPPRTISTLGRRFSNRRHSNNITTSPLMLANDCPEDEEPQITENTLIVGPLIPKNQENIYSTLKLKNKLNNNINPLKATTINELTNDENDIKNIKPSGLKPPSTTFFSANKSIEIQNTILNDKDKLPLGIIEFTSTKPNNTTKTLISSNLPRVHQKFNSNNNNENNYSRIPQLTKLDNNNCKKMITGSNNEVSTRDKSSPDSTSSDTSSSTGTIVKTEMK